MKQLMVLAIAALCSVPVMAAGDAAKGKAKAAVCAGCHGQNGIAMVPNYPNLAGQNAAYLEGALKAYKSQERKGYQAPLMYGMVAALSPQDMADLAAYFASLK